MRGKSIGSRFLNVKLKWEASVKLLGTGAWTGSWSLMRVLGTCDAHGARLCSYRRSRKGDAARGMASPAKRGCFFLFQLLFWRNSTASLRMSSVFFKGLFKKLYCWFSLSFGSFVAGGASGQERCTESLPPAARVPVCAPSLPWAGSVRPPVGALTAHWPQHRSS